MRAAFAADPSLAPAASNLAVLVGAKDPVQAAELCRKAAQLSPEEPTIAIAPRSPPAAARFRKPTIEVAVRELRAVRSIVGDRSSVFIFMHRKDPWRFLCMFPSEPRTIALNCLNQQPAWGFAGRKVELALPVDGIVDLKNYNKRLRSMSITRDGRKQGDLA